MMLNDTVQMILKRVFMALYPDLLAGNEEKHRTRMQGSSVKAEIRAEGFQKRSVGYYRYIYMLSLRPLQWAVGNCRFSLGSEIPAFVCM
jgi:hypothetical protein